VNTLNNIKFKAINWAKAGSYIKGLGEEQKMLISFMNKLKK